MTEPTTAPGPLWQGYAAPGWDEMLGPDEPRAGCAGVVGYLEHLGDELVDR